MSRTAVHDDVPRAGRPLESICFQTVPGRDGRHENFFPGPQIHGGHQIGRNFNTAFILNIATGNHGAMNF